MFDELVEAYKEKRSNPKEYISLEESVEGMEKTITYLQNSLIKFKEEYDKHDHLSAADNYHTSKPTKPEQTTHEIWCETT